eukprot:51708-Chlamydomonas_euryale.AAC.2
MASLLRHAAPAYRRINGTKGDSSVQKPGHATAPAGGGTGSALTPPRASDSCTCSGGRLPPLLSPGSVHSCWRSSGMRRCLDRRCHRPSLKRRDSGATLPPCPPPPPPSPLSPPPRACAAFPP